MSAANKTNRSQNKQGCVTLGFLTNDLAAAYQSAVFRGAAEAALAANATLIAISGRDLDSQEPYQAQANNLFQLANPQTLDGLILLTGVLSSLAESEKFEAFLKQYQQLPRVSIAVELPGTPSILLDNYTGTYKLVEHLIQVHGYRRIGFYRMTAGNPEGESRLQAYREALQAHQIPIEPDWITPAAYYSQTEAVVQHFTGEQGAKVQAIVCFDDYIAIPLQQALQNRGLRLPEQIAVVGFDDVEDCRYLSPPLTTVQQPLYEQGRLAVELALAQVQGQPVAGNITLQPELIIRQSCGCLQKDIVEAGIEALLPGTPAGAGHFAAQKAQICADILRAAGAGARQRSQAEALLQNFVQALESSDPHEYLKALEAAALSVEDPSAWQAALTILRQNCQVAFAGAQEILWQAENLINQGWVLVAELSQRQQAQKRLAQQSQAANFHLFSQSLVSAGRLEELLNAIASDLPALGLPAAYLVFFKNFDSASEQYRLMLAFTEHGRVPLPPQGVTFPGKELLPGPYFSRERGHIYVIEPLLFQETMYGYAIFEQTAAIDSSLMGQLAEQISSALHNAFLIEEVERRAIQLQTAAEVSRAASSILDPAELWQQAVDMIREGFGLYYAGLFLRDDAGEWAILRAGTGEAGQKMLAAGWKLEIGGSSMIGQCIKNGQADIQLNIDKAPIHRRNPYLPETRSEMALPLFSRGEVIGALTIQSALEGAFSEEDVAVLQTMADQLANAIANTRLYEALAKEQSLMKALMENFPEPIYFKDSQSRFMRISNYMLANFNVSSPEEVIGKTDFDFFTEDHARPAYEAEQRIIATGEPLLNVEERETWPDRPDTWVLTSKLPLRDEQNNIIGTFGISRDITASKRTAQSLERRSVQLLASAEIARAAASILDPRELIKQIVQQVRAAFDLYYVGLFLTNPANQFAILQAGTGEAGEKMLASGWKLPIDQQSMIGRCIATGQADIQLDVEKAPARQRNPYLPDTRSEMALPLASRGQVLGALTIQSTQPAAFSEEDVAILQTMSAQVATAIANAQLFEQTQAALQALESTQRRYQLQAWSEYNQRRQISGYMHTAEGLSALESDLLPEVQKTLVEQQPLIWPGNGDEAEAEVTVPLTLRDQPIGVLGLKGRPGKRAWSEEEIALAKEIGEQFALAAESLRLLDETQRRAARERLVAEITTKIRATNDPQAMLSTAISELRQALHAQRTQVSIQPGVDAAPGSGERPPAGFPQNPSSDQVLPKRGKV